MPKRLTTETFVANAKVVHGDRYDYSLTEYQGRHTHVRIICPEHGAFDQKPAYHTLRKAGCPICANAICSRDTFEDFFAKATKRHGDKYTYCSSDYVNSTTKIAITCPIHGDFKQLAFAHVYGQGCPACGLKTNADARRKTTEQFISDARQIHGDVYDYSAVQYTTVHTKVEIGCSVHGPFMQRASDHLTKKSTCPKCSANKLHSIKGIEWLRYISTVEEIEIKHAENGGEFRIPGTNYKVDGYCTATNTVYEFHGDYWHGNPGKHLAIGVNEVAKKTFGELYEETMAREKVIKALGYNLITIWESDWNKLKKIHE